MFKWNIALLVCILSLSSNLEAEFEVQWQTQVKGNHPLGFDLSPNGNIVLLMESGDLETFSPKGEMLWDKQLTAPLACHYEAKVVQCLDNDNICVLDGFLTGKLVMFDQFGNQLWSYGASVRSFSLNTKDNTIAGIDRKGIFCLNKDGKLGWRYHGLFWDTIPCFKDNLIIVPQAPSSVLALNLSDGTVAWTIDRVGFSGPECAPYPDSKILVPFHDSISMYTIFGEQLWNVKLSNRPIFVWCRPTVLENGDIWVGSSNGVTMLDSSGKELWRAPLAGGGVRVPIAVDDDGVGYVVDGKHVYSISPSGQSLGELLPNVKVERRVLIDDNNNIFVVGNDDKLYSFKKNGVPLGTSSQK
jgi:outer membrane protein assembly factor BamB